MALSRIAAEFAAEISYHDWSDAPWRTDRAGHDRESDTNRGREQLSPEETARVRWNVMMVAAQVLGYSDRNFNEYEFAEACGVETLTSRGYKNGGIRAGLRRVDNRLCRPGTWEIDDPSQDE